MPRRARWHQADDADQRREWSTLRHVLPVTQDFIELDPRHHPVALHDALEPRPPVCSVTANCKHFLV